MCNCPKESCCAANATGNVDRRPSQTKAYLWAALSFFMLAAGIIASAADADWFADRWMRLAWYIVASVPVGLPVLRQAWGTLRRREVFTEYTLMSIAATGAFVIGEYPEGVAVLLFYTIGELFQEAAVNRSRKHIGALLDVRPETADVVNGSGVETVPPESVPTGAIVEVKVGKRVPLDGVLLDESAAFNTAALTGESVPRTVRRGGEVLAGMVATDRVAKIKVTKPFGDSALSRILQLVENAAERKAPTEQFIRRFARVYTPIVVALAALIVALPWLYSLVYAGFDYVLFDWMHRGLVFLVISCPCALIVSIPLGYFGGIGAASRNGILFKGSNYLDGITKINTVVMDKTGTLTHGVFEVRKIVAADGIPESELVRIVASVEAQSTHPIAKAIVSYGERLGIPLDKPDSVKEITGRGLEAVAGGRHVLSGNAKLLEEHGVAYPAAIADITETIVMCAVDGSYAGYFLVADALRDDAAEAVSSLRKQGVGHIVVLSGDRQAIVSKVASELGITEAIGDLLPQGKVDFLERLKADPANNVAFVGDGINDAPVLALSDIGIAMGGLGSDAAIETANVVIQTDQPSKVATAIRIGRATRRIVIQNIGMAFGVKLAVLALGAWGMATLWEAVFADVGVSLLAILNAARILRTRF